MRTTRITTLLAVTAAAAVSVPVAAQARHGADDAPGHVRHVGADDGARGAGADPVRARSRTRTRARSHAREHRRHGGDDGPGHVRHGGDDGPGHVRHGGDDGPGHP